MEQMSGPEDHRLLAAFARAGSETAFATLVARYVNLVYSTAARFTGNPHHAEEITQAVFIILARKAGKISPRVVLSGWLYQVARLTSANFVKGEIRRQRREQEAYMQSALNEPDKDGWHEIAPWLDEAMGQLGKTDRDAVVLRYFENKSAAEIGAVLRMSEETARKRVNRALEKLHRYFSQRGIVSTTAIIAGAISANCVQAAPVALAKTVTPVAIAKGSMAAGSTLTLVKATLNIMNWTRMKIAVATGAAVILAAGTTTLLAQHQGQDQPQRGLPYKMLDDACQFSAGVDQSKFVVRVLIESKNKNVHPADIHLTIESAVKGPIPVQLDKDGQVVNFPHDPELRRENPRVVTDQPKGSMNLTLTTFLPKPEGLTFPYRRLGDELAEVNKAITSANSMILAGYAGELPPYKVKVQGVIFVFPKTSAGNARVEIAASSGRKEFVADGGGRVRLKVDAALVAENPQVTLSEPPQYMMPDLHP
jgi:RNA polymerase sigma factor (sigma-70 family)